MHFVERPARHISWRQRRRNTRQYGVPSAAPVVKLSAVHERTADRSETRRERPTLTHLLCRNNTDVVSVTIV